jgi:hypothetical protein
MFPVIESHVHEIAGYVFDIQDGQKNYSYNEKSGDPWTSDSKTGKYE